VTYQCCVCECLFKSQFDSFGALFAGFVIFYSQNDYFRRCFGCYSFRNCKMLSSQITSLNNGVFNFVNFNRSMQPSSSKRCHLASGTTPNKPAKKWTRDFKSKIRKPLNFSSENVPVENESESDGLLSPEIKMRSRGSPSFKVTKVFFFFFC